jgi:hypothetical protein
MGVRLRPRGARAVVAVGVTVALLAAALTSSAAGSGASASLSGATWSSDSPVTSVSTTVYVAAIDCSSVAAGSYAGQRSGIEVFGSYASNGQTVYPFDFGGYYSYCNGKTAIYSPEFLTSDPGTGMLTFRPAGFAISPGDPLTVTITRRSSGVTLTITDINTKQSQTVTGPRLGRSTGWAAGVMPIYGPAGGGPYLTGSVPLVDQYSPSGGPNPLDGPAPFAPVVFGDMVIDGKALSAPNSSIQETKWIEPSGSAVADVSLPRRGSFVASRIKPPQLGKSADVTPVHGSVLIQIPGTHKFVKLHKGLQIPNDSKIDTTHGSVQVTLGLPHGKSETGVFYDGQFLLHQNGKTGSTTATLTGGSSGGCAKTAKVANYTGPGVASVAKAKSKSNGKSNGKKVGSLWANAHGSFTTKGSGGAAAVLGTKWYTENTCGGTYFKVIRDKIKVTAYYPHPHTVIVTQGHSFFAPDKAKPATTAATPIIDVAPVTTTNGRYNVHVSGEYKLTVVSKTRPAYVDAAVAPNQPSGGNTQLFPDGTVNGTPRWYIEFHITPDLSHFQDWNVGVQVGGTLYLVRLHVS